jgi:hypothetical protein
MLALGSCACVAGEAGDASLLPELAACLLDPALAVPAHEAMWQIFLRCSNLRVSELMAEGIGYGVHVGRGGAACGYVAPLVFRLARWYTVVTVLAISPMVLGALVNAVQLSGLSSSSWVSLPSTRHGP